MFNPIGRHLTALNHLSSRCHDRLEAFGGVKSTIETMIKSIRLLQHRDLLDRLRRLKIGTPQIEAAARQVTGFGRPRDASEVTRILRRRLRDSVGEMIELERRWRIAKHALRDILEPASAWREYIRLEDRIRREVWREGKTVIRDRIANFIWKVEERERREHRDPQHDFFKVRDEDKTYSH